MLAGASLTLCSVAAAVTTNVSSSFAASAGNATDMTDAHSPARTKGFNLNIPNLHEVNNKSNKGVLLSHTVGSRLLRLRAQIFTVDVAGRPLPLLLNSKKWRLASS
jgi:hypothetical protein